MIPKIIHYCWFGRGEKNEVIKKCVESWRFFLPDYEIKVWDEDNFDVDSIPYTRDAYKEKKYAFVSDYARLYLLYQYGGLYFDVDVELIKPIGDIIEKGPFMACESTINGPLTVNPGLIVAAEPRMQFFADMIAIYQNESFYNQDGSLNVCTINERVSSKMDLLGWRREDRIQKVKDFYIYPSSYFCPMDWYSKKIKVTANTYSIHWYAGSWIKLSLFDKTKEIIKQSLPICLLKLLLYIKKWMLFGLKFIQKRS